LADAVGCATGVSEADFAWNAAVAAARGWAAVSFLTLLGTATRYISADSTAAVIAAGLADAAWCTAFLSKTDGARLAAEACTSKIWSFTAFPYWSFFKAGPNAFSTTTAAPVVATLLPGAVGGAADTGIALCSFGTALAAAWIRAANAVKTSVRWVTLAARSSAKVAAALFADTIGNAAGIQVADFSLFATVTAAGIRAA